MELLIWANKKQSMTDEADPHFHLHVLTQGAKASLSVGFQ